VAQLLVEGSDLVLHLRLREKVGGFHADIRAPLTAVRSVAPVRNPWAVLRGWRMAGLGFPGVVALGTRRHRDGFDFTAVRRMRPCVQVELGRGRFSRLIVSLPEGSDMEAAQHEADRIADAAGIARSRPLN
jgi:hypothetical protein